MRKTLLALLTCGMLLPAPASAINFLTGTGPGDYLTDSYGGRLVLAGDIGTVLQLRTFGKSPNLTVVSIIADISNDLSTISTRGFVNEDGFTIVSVSIYLNNVVQATCPGNTCEVDIPTSKMLPGANRFLVAYFNSANVGRGAAFEMSKP